MTNFRTHRQWVGCLLLMPFILYLDQANGNGPNWLGQNIGSIIGWTYMFATYGLSSPRLQRLMIVGLVVALGGELFLAFGLDMYSYRLDNIPFYVPPGHVGAMCIAHCFVREPWVIRHHRKIELVFFSAAGIYAFAWLYFLNDVYGFILYLCFVLTIALTNRSRTFFLTIFIVTTYMELIGTTLGCWSWHPTLMGQPEGLAGANPPAGISFLYFFFDISCLGNYLHTKPELKARFNRLKAYRRSKTVRGRWLNKYVPMEFLGNIIP